MPSPAATDGDVAGAPRADYEVGESPETPSLALSSLEDVLTSLSVTDINTLICLLPKINDEHIQTYLIEYDMITPEGNEDDLWIATPHKETIRTRVADFMEDGVIDVNH